MATDTSSDAARQSITEEVRHHAEALPAPERAEEFGAVFAGLGAARIVLLGEATHGT